MRPTHFLVGAAGALAVLLAFSLGRWSTAPSPSSAAPAGKAVPGAEAPALASGFDPSPVPLGRLPWHSSVPFVGRFVNNRAEAAIVAAIRSSCGCTGIESKDYVGKVIEPGQSLDVSGTIDVGERLGTRSVEVDLMMVSGAIYTLALAYEAYPTYLVQPAELTFSGVDLDAESDLSDAEQRVVFTPMASSGSRLADRPAADVPWLQAGFAERPDGSAEISVQVVKQNLSHGKNWGWLTLHTSDRFKPETRVRVIAEGVAQVTATPGHVLLKRGGEAYVTFRDSDGNGLNVEVEGDTDGLQVRRTAITNQLYIAADASQPVTDEPIALSVRAPTGARGRFLVSILR